MGDRYELELHCAYCNKLNGVWYAPTCGFNTFVCKSCKNTNFIKDFKSVKTDDITGNDLFNNFMDDTNVSWEDEDLEKIKKECHERSIEIKNNR